MLNKSLISSPLNVSSLGWAALRLLGNRTSVPLDLPIYGFLPSPSQCCLPLTLLSKPGSPHQPSPHTARLPNLSFQMPTAPLPSHYHFLRFPKQIVCPIKLCVNCFTIRIKCVYFQMTWSFWLPCLKVTKSSSRKGGKKMENNNRKERKGQLQPEARFGKV